MEINETDLMLELLKLFSKKGLVPDHPNLDAGFLVFDDKRYTPDQSITVYVDKDNIVIRTNYGIHHRIPLADPEVFDKTINITIKFLKRMPRWKRKLINANVLWTEQ